MSLTPKEYFKYQLSKDVTSGNIDAVLENFSDLVDEADSLRLLTVQQDKTEEILSEQIYFRDTFIEEVISACDSCKTKKELVAFIKTTLENSYIEL